MLKALCVDLMDTLVVDPYREAIEAATGLAFERVVELRDPRAWPAFEIGAIDEAEFARRFFAGGGGARLDLEAFNRARRAGYRLMPGMGALLEATRGRLERYVATNYPVWVADVVEAFGLAELTDGVFASAHLGVRKPDPAFFARLLEAIGREPEAVLFVDDRDVNCAAAEAAGMRAHRFSGAADLAARLVAEGIALEGMA